MELAIRDQFVCGLRDSKCQKELLCVAELTADLALQQAKAVEVIRKETEAMQESHKESELEDHSETHRFHSAKLQCYRCGKPYHSAADCRFKDATCHVCKKVGHIWQEYAGHAKRRLGLQLSPCQVRTLVSTNFRKVTQTVITVLIVLYTQFSNLEDQAGSFWSLCVLMVWT